MCRFLAQLRLLEVVIRSSREVGAGILPVGVEEQIVDGAVDIVVMGDVAARALVGLNWCIGAAASASLPAGGSSVAADGGRSRA